MEISWSLIINYPNHLNLLNLRNYTISQSINRGLGEGIKRMNFGREKLCWWYIFKNLGAAELRVLWLQRSPCLRSWVVLLSHSLIVNKKNSSSNLVLSLFHVFWLMNIFDYMFDILFI